MTVSSILDGRDREIITVTSDTSVAEAVALLARERIGAVPVVDGGEVAGIFSERDIIYHLQSDGASILDWPVSRAMTSPAVTIGRDVPLLSALALMTRRRVRHLPVIDGGKLVGFVSIGDLVKQRIDGIEREAAAMRDYIQGS